MPKGGNMSECKEINWGVEWKGFNSYFNELDYLPEYNPKFTGDFITIRKQKEKCETAVYANTKE